MNAAQQATTWPVPQPLSAGQIRVPDIEPDMIPEPLRRWLCELAEEYQFPLVAPAAAALCGFSAVVTGKWAVRTRGNHLERPNLWGVLVAPPGSMKSGLAATALAPIFRLDSQLSEAFFEAKARWRVTESVRKKAARALEKRLSEAWADGNQDVANYVEQQLVELMTPVFGPQLIAGNHTVETMPELFGQTRRGILLYRDEMAAWWQSMKGPGKEAARATWLEMWRGDVAAKVGRIGRAGDSVRYQMLAVFGTTQPDVVRELREHLQDGFLARFQMGVWPDLSAEYDLPEVVPRNIDDVCELADSLFRAEGDEIVLSFSDAGQAAFDEYMQAAVRAARSGILPDEHAPVVSKSLSTVAAIATISHALESSDDEVIAARHVARAVRWAFVLGDHAQKIAAGRKKGDAPGERLGRRLTLRHLSGAFTVRDLYKRGWAGLRTKEEAQKAVDYLVERKWLLLQSSKYQVNPRIHEVSSEESD